LRGLLSRQFRKLLIVTLRVEECGLLSRQFRKKKRFLSRA